MGIGATGRSIGQEFVLLLCERQFGVGADGIITIGRGKAVACMVTDSAGDCRLEMCGNTLRPLAKWVRDRRSAGIEQAIQTAVGLLDPRVIDTTRGRARRIRVYTGVRFDAGGRANSFSMYRFP